MELKRRELMQDRQSVLRVGSPVGGDCGRCKQVEREGTNVEESYDEYG